MEDGGVDNASPFQDFCKKRRSIFVIKNQDDNLCLPRSIVIGAAFAKKDESHEHLKRYHNLKENMRVQQIEATELCRAAGVPLDICGNIEALRLFQ